MRICVWFVAAAIAACGGPAAPPPAAPTAKPVPAVGSGSGSGSSDVTVEQTCVKFSELARTGCGGFDKLAPADDLCVDLMGPILLDKQGHALAVCAVRQPSCDAVLACIKAIPKTETAAAELRACHAPGGAAVGLPRAEWEHRNGAATQDLAHAASTKDTPIETCGINEEAAWIDGATCNDGSQPAHGKTEAMRVGNVGRGGRCGSIIDQYRVPCPERTYDVFVDAYVCAQL